MDIFESLENLNVSEECFEEIMDMVEGLVGEIKRKHGEPEYKYSKETGTVPANKSAELLAKRDDAWGKEIDQAKEREGSEKVKDKRFHTKDEKGYMNTIQKQIKDRAEKIKTGELERFRQRPDGSYVLLHHKNPKFRKPLQ
jgi:hypothetical protein